jgi:hypothetical protein
VHCVPSPRHRRVWSADGWQQPKRCAVTFTSWHTHRSAERRGREHAAKHDVATRRQALRPRPYRCSLGLAPYSGYG